MSSINSENFKFNLSTLSIANLNDEDNEDRAYWLLKSPKERLIALEYLRQVMYALNKVDTQKDFCENLRVFSGLYIAIMAFKIYEPNKQFELEKGPLLCEQNHSSFYNSRSNKSCRKINRLNQFR